MVDRSEINIDIFSRQHTISLGADLYSIKYFCALTEVPIFFFTFRFSLFFDSARLFLSSSSNYIPRIPHAHESFFLLNLSNMCILFKSKPAVVCNRKHASMLMWIKKKMQYRLFNCFQFILELNKIK